MFLVNIFTFPRITLNRNRSESLDGRSKDVATKDECIMQNTCRQKRRNILCSVHLNLENIVLGNVIIVLSKDNLILCGCKDTFFY